VVIAIGPKVVMFDELTSTLDPMLIGEVLDVMKVLANGGMTTVVVIHEMAFVSDVADRVVFIGQGAIAEEGDPLKMFSRPGNERT
jgi:ABC-type polar amino acid transport system ATPase subunit